MQYQAHLEQGLHRRPLSLGTAWPVLLEGMPYGTVVINGVSGVGQYGGLSQFAMCR